MTSDRAATDRPSWSSRRPSWATSSSPPRCSPPWPSGMGRSTWSPRRPRRACSRPIRRCGSDPVRQDGADAGARRLPSAAARAPPAAAYERAYLPHRSLALGALALLRASRADRLRRQSGRDYIYLAGAPSPSRATRSSGCWRWPVPEQRRRRPSTSGCTAEDQAAADRWLQTQALGPGFVALAPGSIWGTKRWPYYRRAGSGAGRSHRGGRGAEDDAAGRSSRRRRAEPGPERGRCAGLRGSAALIQRARGAGDQRLRAAPSGHCGGDSRRGALRSDGAGVRFRPAGSRDRIVGTSGPSLPALLGARAPGLSAWASSVHAGAGGRDRRCRRSARRHRLGGMACDSFSGIDIGGTNLVVGSVAEDGSSLHALAQRADHGRSRGRATSWTGSSRWPSRPSPQTKREVPGRGDRGGRRRRAGAARHQERHRAAHPQPRLGQPAAAPDHSRAAGASRGAGQRRQLRRAGRVVGGRRPGHPHTPSASPSGPGSAAGSSWTAGSFTAPRTARARSATPRSIPRAAAASAATTAAWRPTPPGPTSRSAPVEAIEAGAESRLPDLCGRRPREITAQTVYEAAHDGDELALEVVNDTARFLGAGHRQPGQCVQSRGRGGLRWGDPGGRPPVRARSGARSRGERSSRR